MVAARPETTGSGGPHRVRRSRAGCSAAVDAGAIGYLLKDAEPDELIAGSGRPPAASRRSTRRPPGRCSPAARERAAPQLSEREREVLRCVGEGLPNKLIARRLEISEKTVKAHLTRVYQQIGVTDRTQAALWAKERGL